MYLVFKNENDNFWDFYNILLGKQVNVFIDIFLLMWVTYINLDNFDEESAIYYVFQSFFSNNDFIFLILINISNQNYLSNEIVLCY
jgi:hypothetical protein